MSNTETMEARALFILISLFFFFISLYMLFLWIIGEKISTAGKQFSIITLFISGSFLGYNIYDLTKNNNNKNNNNKIKKTSSSYNTKK